MDVKMVGIDYSKAGIEVRELFAMTKSNAAAAMRQICAESQVEGCVLLSTCNRTELWTSGGNITPYEALCAVQKTDAAKYHRYFTERSGHEAITHLFELSCGLKSQVFGEDQIITQIKNAITLSRETGSADAVLENLFRTAVTAAKRVKTDVRLLGSGRSVAVSTVSFLRERLGSLNGISCMVIGNGEMGRLAATELINEGANVIMTVRQHHHGEVIIPDGVRAISYDLRLERLPEVQVVVSATTSPHYTLRAEDVALLQHPTIFCDLAVPRDIDPDISELRGASLYDTDAICGGGYSRADVKKLSEARAILWEYIDEFESWYGFRTLVPIVNEISGLAAEDLVSRVSKSIRRLDLENGQQEQLTARINDAAEKVVGRLMFGLRDNLAPELWQSCIEGLQKAARREELR
ncbi:glutamyl-tRNA reductase [Oscillospiraceae bacterium PP1C4]